MIVYDTESDLVDLLLTLQGDYGDSLVRFLGADWKDRDFTGKHMGIANKFTKRDHNWSTSELRNRVWFDEALSRFEKRE